jgi:hypothetical protein
LLFNFVCRHTAVESDAPAGWCTQVAIGLEQAAPRMSERCPKKISTIVLKTTFRVLSEVDSGKNLLAVLALQELDSGTTTCVTITPWLRCSKRMSLAL